MAMSGLLAGRLALITGAGSGIGKAVCQVFAREGALLAAVDVNQESAHKTIDSLPKVADRTHHAFCADISSSGSINELMQNIQSAFKEVPTIAVNSAGITKDAMMLKMSEENFDRVIDVNLKGTFLLNQAVSRAIIGASIKNGSIVNISSIVGKVGNIGQANYAATKSGVIGLTKTAAKELAGYGIRVNAILPGFIETPMTNVVPEKVVERMKVLIPQGRLGKPEEIAEACLYLASDKSSYVTGAALEVTGGFLM